MSGLYDQIGEDALRAAVREFHDRLFADPILCFIFAGTDKERLTQKEWEFTAKMLGGPVKYTGRTLKAAHSSSLILEGHFYRRLRILEQTLIDQHVAPEVREAWLSHTLSLQPTLKKAITRSLLPKRFELFVGTAEQRERWRTQGMEKTLRSIWDWVLLKAPEAADYTASEVEQCFQMMLKAVTERLVHFEFESAVSALVVFIEYVVHPQHAVLPASRQILRELTVGLTSFAPRLSEALWELIGEEGLVYDQSFPTYDSRRAADSAAETGTA